MKQEETKDEALKADESQIEVESPATEAPTEVAADTAESEEGELPPVKEGEEVESEAVAPEETEGTPEKTGRKTAQTRIRDLVAEKKEAEKKTEVEKERADSLADQVKKATSFKPDQAPPFDPTKQQSEEKEITVDELMRRQDALVQLRLAQQDNVHRVQQEASEAIQTHPELNPDSEAFDSELSEAISQATLAKIQGDPTSDVKKFVSSLMKPYKRSLDKQAAGQKETITKQVSEQAMRPTQVQEQEKPFSELSISEMEKKLGTVHR